ncbi:MAG: hypothetical protein AB7N24_15975 [Dehalococcoidia bacterium]
MRIGELDDAVGKEFTARRGNMLAEAAKLPAKLAEPPSGATAPAVAMSDSVHISPEARAAQFGPMPAANPLGMLPSPSEVASAIENLATAAPGSPAAAAGVAQLVSLAVQASGLPPASLPALPPATREQVAGLVRALLTRANQPGGAATTASAGEIQVLVRELVGALAQPATSASSAPVSTYERAAAVLLVALAKEAAQGPNPQVAGQVPGDLPPALLELLAMPQPVRRRPAKRRRDEAQRFDFDDDEEDGDEAAPDYFTTK